MKSNKRPRFKLDGWINLHKPKGIGSTPALGAVKRALKKIAPLSCTTFRISDRASTAAIGAERHCAGNRSASRCMAPILHRAARARVLAPNRGALPRGKAMHTLFGPAVCDGESMMKRRRSLASCWQKA